MWKLKNNSAANLAKNNRRNSSISTQKSAENDAMGRMIALNDEILRLLFCDESDGAISRLKDTLSELTFVRIDVIIDVLSDLLLKNDEEFQQVIASKQDKNKYENGKHLEARKQRI